MKNTVKKSKILEILTRKELNQSEKLLLVTLKASEDSDGVVRGMSQSEMAGLCSLSRQAINYTVKNLIVSGYLDVFYPDNETAGILNYKVTI